MRIWAHATVMSAFILVFSGWALAARTESAVRVTFPVAEDSSPNLLNQIGTDFKNVFTTKDNLVIAAAGLGAAWGVSHFDKQIASSGLNSELNEGATLDYFFEAGQILGGGLVQVGDASATYGLGKLLSKLGLEDLERDLVRAQVVTGSLTSGIKVAVGRHRPDASNKLSFLSGHAADRMAHLLDHNGIVPPYWTGSDLRELGFIYGIFARAKRGDPRLI